MVTAGDNRGRQNKKDEALRRKLEADISRRRRPVGTTKQGKKLKGSVLALKPDNPVTMDENTNCHEAAQYMCARKASCVLVVDSHNAVAGIFTAKDLAFKVVGAGLDPAKIRLAQIMTPQPMCASTATSATDALDLMVKRGFRHLPVLDEDGEVAGVLDITRCFFEAMQKLDRAYESSRKLSDALEGVQSELGAAHPSQLVSYVQALRQHTAGPTLEGVLDGSPPLVVDVRTAVREATEAMIEAHTTAALVMDNDSITGIFTSKDVVNRVMAAGLDAAKVSVVRVMTPQPDYAPVSTPIQDALRKMHEGHYLNLPVMDEDGSVLGIVDVLRLTYATLEQIKSMASGSASPSEEGPAWNKFWMSLDDTESVHSAHSDTHRSETTLPSEVRGSELRSEVRPDASSVAALDELAPEDSLSRQGFREEVPLSFKFKAPSGRTHKIQVKDDSLETLREQVSTKLGAADLAKLGGPGYALSYVDGDGDLVAITSDHDVADVLEYSRSCRLSKIDLHVHHIEQQPVQAASIKPEYIVGAVAVVAIAALVLFRPRH